MKIRTYFIPKASLKTHIVLLLVFIVLGMIGIGISANGSVAIETVYAATFIFITLQIYYFIMIYNGVKYDNGITKWKWEGVSIKEMLENMDSSHIDINKIEIPSFDFGDNVIGAIIGAIVAVLLGVLILGVIVILSWIGVNLIGYAIFISWIPLYILVKYGVRLALVNVKYAKGNLVRSFFLSSFHGFIGAITMSIIFLLTEIIIRMNFG